LFPGSQLPGADLQVAQGLLTADSGH
jgi:hypothetical protein